MVSDPTIIALAVGIGLLAGLAVLHIMYHASRGFQRAVRKAKCACGFHAPSGQFQPAVGGRDVMRCLYCDQVVYEVQRSKESLKRVK